MSNPPPVDRSDGVVAVIRRDQRYLMIQRAPDILAGGTWCFVGGGMHAGETQQEAVTREVLEEVGLSVEPVQKVWETRSPCGLRVLHCWEVHMLNDTVQPDPAEVSDYRWLTQAELATWPNLLPSVHAFFAARREVAD